MADALQQERAAFEEFLLREGWRPADVRRDDGGYYVSSSVRSMWAGWLMRVKHANGVQSCRRWRVSVGKLTASNGVTYIVSVERPDRPQGLSLGDSTGRMEVFVTTVEENANAEAAAWDSFLNGATATSPNDARIAVLFGEVPAGVKGLDRG